MSERQDTRNRVLIVTTWLPTEKAPLAGNFIERDIRTLSRVANVRVLHFVSPSLDDGKRTLSLHEVIVERHVMDMKNPFSIMRARRLVRAEAKKVDLVHTMAISSVLPVVSQGIDRPWVHTEHWSGFLAWNTGWRRVVRGLFSVFLSKATAVVAVSDLLGGAMRASLKRRVVVIPNQVDAELIERPVSGQTLIENRCVKLVSVGNMVESKRPKLAVETLHELQRRGWKVSLTWFGDGPLRNQMIAYARRLGVSAEFPGIISPSEVSTAIGAYDLFLLPTEYETFCLAAAEALSVGRPVVMGANGGQSAFVTPNVGRLVEGDTASAYADAVEELLQATQQTDAEYYGRHIRQKYSPQAFVNAYRKLYSSLLND